MDYARNTQAKRQSELIKREPSILHAPNPHQEVMGSMKEWVEFDKFVCAVCRKKKPIKGRKKYRNKNYQCRDCYEEAED